MKKLNKIYIEITNACNLNCSFCIKNKRTIKYMTVNEFIFILDKIRPICNNIYLHVLGEPLMHPDIIEFIRIANEKGFNVMLTTNGYLINKLNKDIRIKRLNISLHSYNTKYKISLNDYLINIFDYIDSISDNTFINLRFWLKDDNTKDIIEFINKRYNLCIENIEDNSKINVCNNIFIDTFHEFIWPDLDNNYYNEFGKCLGLRDHIGILSDGTIIPCCLDSMGVINLGNIYKDNIDDIYNSKRVNDMINNFRNNKKCEELCRHCSFLGDRNESC